MSLVVHATCICRRVGSVWRAALLFGPPGSGKSDMALRGLAHGWRLVSDDYCVVWASGDRIWARAPAAIADRIEARGLGVLDLPRRDLAEVVVAVRCETGPVERMPEPDFWSEAGPPVPLVALNALESSALFKLERVVSTRVLGA